MNIQISPYRNDGRVDKLPSSELSCVLPLKLIEVAGWTFDDKTKEMQW